MTTHTPERLPIESVISPWMPIDDKHDLALLAKLIEECNELSGRAARIIMSGWEEPDPKSGKTNREELRNETSDVEACITMLRRAKEGVEADIEREYKKVRGFNRWHKMIANLLAGRPAE